jgi:hypothetical protein
MSSADLFRRYADEALRRAMQCQTEKEQRALFDLALTWTQAALKADSVEPRAPVARSVPSAASSIPGGRMPAPMSGTHHGQNR